MQNTAEGVAGPEPIAVSPRALLLKIAHRCYLPVRRKCKHGRMLTWGFSKRGFPVLGLMLGVPVTQGTKVGLKKLESLGYSSVKIARSYGR